LSGLAGLFHRDGRPVERRAVERMLALIAHRGPDGCGVWSADRVALGQCLLHTTPESPRHAQPATTPDGRVILVFDGRVDNRSELQRHLSALSSATDSELVLLAYERWGRDAPAHLIGDFAFALWDGRARRVFCARDPAGLRPFFYFLDGTRFVFGSESQQLVRSGGVTAQPNEGMVAEYLACAITHPTETLLRGILRLSPGFTLTVTADRVSCQRYWTPAPAGDDLGRDDDECAEAFRAVFTESVRARMRTDGAVALALSGGIDSSAIGVTARHISGAPLETFTLAFPGLPCDECAYASMTAAHIGAPWTPIDARPGDPVAYRSQAARYVDLPDYPNGAMLDPLRAAVRDRSARVLLTGNGGDQWFTSTFAAYADLAAAFRLVPLMRAARRDRRGFGADYPPFAALRFGLWPLLPPRARDVLSRGLRAAVARPKTPPWIAPAFARRVALEDRLRVTPPPFGLASRAREALCLEATCAWEVHFSEMDDRATSVSGLDARAPFLDRRVIEFAIGLSEEQRRRGARARWIVRRALESWLPPQVAARTEKADFSHVFVDALADTAHGADACVAEAGWIVPRHVAALERRMRQRWSAEDRRYSADAWHLWMIRAVDMWLSGLSRPSPGVSACSTLVAPGGTR